MDPADAHDIPLGLAYDDVLIVPRRSAIASRRDVDTRTSFTRRIDLAVPIVSANMDTVTEAAMAIALAQLGGIGVLHRFQPLAEQAEEVERVKRRAAYVIAEPYRIGPERTLREAREVVRRHGVSGLAVTADDGTLLGLLTARDIGAVAPDSRVRDAMTPLERLVTARPDVGLAEARALMRGRRVEKLPLVAGGRLAGLITLRDSELRERYPHATLDASGRPRVAAAVGVRGDYLARAEALVAADVDALVLDIAHGHSENALAALRALRAAVPDVDVVAGNVATAEGVRDLAEAGAAAIKVGIGPGFACTTRLVAGAGVPQLTSVLACAAAGRALGVPVIADGGVRHPADVAKAMAAGADSVMVGSLLAGTRESPGEVVERDGRRYKVYRGMASRAAAAGRPDRLDEALDQYVPEGAELVVPLKESVAEIVTQLVGGLRSGMSYVGARDLAAFRHDARFVRITAAGQLESQAGGSS